MANRDAGGAGSARRRRERRLRSWWRHERMTVAAELAVAFHHSRGVGPKVPYDALRGQTPASSGMRPDALREPAPQLGVERAACPRSTGPSPLPDLGCCEVHDATLVAFLVRQTLLQREEEEKAKVELEKEEAVDDELAASSPVPAAAAAGVDDHLPPQHWGTVIMVMGNMGLIQEDEGKCYTFLPTLMTLQVGFRVSFCVRGHEAYDVVWET